MDSKELIKRTTDFAHRCVKLSVSLPNINKKHRAFFAK